MLLMFIWRYKYKKNANDEKDETNKPLTWLKDMNGIFTVKKSQRTSKHIKRKT